MILANRIDALITIVFMLFALTYLGRHLEPRPQWTPEQHAAKVRRRERGWWCALVVLGLSVLRLANAGVSPGGQWQTFSSAGGGYCADFPAAVSEETSERTANGITVTTHRAEYFDRSRDATYHVTYRDPGPQGFVTVDGLINALRPEYGAPRKRRSISVDGVQGEELVFHLKEKVSATCWVFPHREKFLWVALLVTDDHARDPEVGKFLPSFHFVPAVSAR
jgi:hypothetical protein